MIFRDKNKEEEKEDFISEQQRKEILYREEIIKAYVTKNCTFKHIYMYVCTYIR